MGGTVGISFSGGGGGAGTYAANQSWQGGKLALCASATTWTTGSVQFQMLVNGVWINVGTAFTANGLQIVELPPGQIQVVATGGSLAGLSVNAYSVPTITTR